MVADSVRCASVDFGGQEPIHALPELGQTVVFSAILLVVYGNYVAPLRIRWPTALRLKKLHLLLEDL